MVFGLDDAILAWILGSAGTAGTAAGAAGTAATAAGPFSSLGSTLGTLGQMGATVKGIGELGDLAGKVQDRLNPKYPEAPVDRSSLVNLLMQPIQKRRDYMMGGGRYAV